MWSPGGGSKKFQSAEDMKKESRIKVARNPVTRAANPAYEERQEKVRAIKEDIIAGRKTAKDWDHQAGTPRLKTAVSGGLPLCFETQQDLADFQKDILQGLSFGPIEYDVAVYLLGSSTHGFSMNPTKELRPWRPPSDPDPSDADLAVCSSRGLMYHMKDAFNDHYDFIAKDDFYKKSAFGQVFEQIAKKWTERSGVKFSFKLQLNPESGPRLQTNGAFEIVNRGNHTPMRC